MAPSDEITGLNDAVDGVFEEVADLMRRQTEETRRPLLGERQPKEERRQLYAERVSDPAMMLSFHDEIVQRFRLTLPEDKPISRRWVRWLQDGWKEMRDGTAQR